MWWVAWWHSGRPEPQPGPQLILVPQRGKGALLDCFPTAVGSCQHPSSLSRHHRCWVNVGKMQLASLPGASFGPAEHPLSSLTRHGAKPAPGAGAVVGELGGERSSNGLPGLVNGLNVLLGFHAE